MEKCQICGKDLTCWRDMMDYILLEESKECLPHYSYYYGFGYTTIAVGSKEFDYRYDTPAHEMKEIGKLIDAEILKVKATYRTEASAT